jgi:DHA1 family bicyclomycin/chloramphenicol resistance-like MFS transporter
MQPAEREISRPEFIALIAALMALNSLAIDVMLPALPAMGEALKVMHENERQYVLTAYLVGFGIAQLFFGPLSDRCGRRPTLMVGLAIYIAAAALAVIAPNFFTLLVLRTVQGIGAAATRVVGQSAVRDRFSGRAMGEVMSLIFMVFMVIPVIAPAIGQLLLFSGHWELIFLFMAGLAAVVALWAYLRLKESLAVEARRPLHPHVIAQGFALVFSNRSALFYGISSIFVMGALFGFIGTAQQIYVDIYGLGAWFPVAFAAVAGLMSVSSFLNSRIVGRFGMRRVTHTALICFALMSGIWLILAMNDMLPFTAFMIVFALTMFSFGMVGSNSQALAMEPLGAVAGTAASVFGFMQTAGGAAIGAWIGAHYNGTVVPTAAGYFILALVSIGCILIAEKGRLFGVGLQYQKRS